MRWNHYPTSRQKIRWERILKPSNNLTRLLATYFPNVLIVALAIGIPIALPTGLARNVGYVDPNLYIGYALNHSWLMSAGGYEYHATRLPFIWIIETLLQFSRYIEFGLLFKAITLVSLGLILNKLGSHLEINNLAKWSLVTSILISPIAISISSWTIPNGWAAIFCLLMIVNSFNNEHQLKDRIFGGMLFATCLLMNVYGAIISLFACLTIKFIIRDTAAKSKIKNLKDYFLFSIASMAVYELIWRYIWHGKTSMWMEHLKLFLNRDEVSVTYWGPVLNFSEQGVWTLFILGLAVPMYNLLSKRIALTKIQIACYSGSLALTLLSIIAYLVKINIAYTQYFYLYFYLPIFVLTTFAAISQIKSRQLLYTGMFLSINFLIILITAFAGINWLTTTNIIFLATFILIFTIATKKNAAKVQNQVSLTSTFLGMILLFLIPPFMSGYSSEQNERNELLIQDQRKVFEEISLLPSNFGKVATWYEPDEIGYRGAILSSIGFHLLRLEGGGENQPFPSVSGWKIRKGTIPDYLIAITSDTWRWNGELKNRNMYEVKREVTLPSKKVKMYIFHRLRGKS